LSSVRLHTRSIRDWSSDACSSNLFAIYALGVMVALVLFGRRPGSEQRTPAHSVGEAAEEHERGDDAERVDREELRGEGGAEAESVLVEGIERCGQGRAHHHDGEYVRRGGQAPPRGGSWFLAPWFGRLIGHFPCAPFPALRVRRGGCARRAVSDCTLEPGYP